MFSQGVSLNSELPKEVLKTLHDRKTLCCKDLHSTSKESNRGTNQWTLSASTFNLFYVIELLSVQQAKNMRCPVTVSKEQARFQVGTRSLKCTTKEWKKFMVWANPGCFCIILMEGLECGESGEEWDGVGVFFWLPLGPWISTQECLNGIIYLFQECARKFLLPLSPIEHLAVRQKKKRLSAEILSCAFIQIAKTSM